MAAIRVRRTYSFTCLPESLIRNLAVSDRAVRLWALLDRYAKGDEFVSLTRETLAADLGCSLDSIDRALAELVRFGWLSHNGARGGRPREYQLWINEELRTRADNLVRNSADNLPHGCGQLAAPVRTTGAPDLGEQGAERGRGRDNPLTPNADALGGCAKHPDRKHARCRGCGTAGRPRTETPQPPPVAKALSRCPHDATPGHCPTCRRELP